MKIVKILLVLIFVGFVVIGVVRKEFSEILYNSTILCLPCIGVG